MLGTWKRAGRRFGRALPAAEVGPCPASARLPAAAWRSFWSWLWRRGGLGWGLAVKPQAPIREPASASSLPAAPVPAPAPEPVAPPARRPFHLRQRNRCCRFQPKSPLMLSCPLGSIRICARPGGLRSCPQSPPPAGTAGRARRAAEPAVPPRQDRSASRSVAKAAAPSLPESVPPVSRRLRWWPARGSRPEAEYRRPQTLLAAGQTSVGAEALAAALRLDRPMPPARRSLLRLPSRGSASTRRRGC